MTVKGPWYITTAAVEAYQGLCGWPDDDEHFDRAEDALIEIAGEAKLVREQDNGLHLYKGPPPNRLRLIVSPKPGPEGDLPQLVQVIGEHDGVRRIKHVGATREIKMPRIDGARYEQWKAAARAANAPGIHQWIIDACDEAARRR